MMKEDLFTQACGDLCEPEGDDCFYSNAFNFWFCQHVLGSKSFLPLKLNNAITEMHLEVNNTIGWIYSTVRLAGILEVNVDLKAQTKNLFFLVTVQLKLSLILPLMKQRTPAALMSHSICQDSNKTNAALLDLIYLSNLWILASNQCIFWVWSKQQPPGLETGANVEVPKIP